MNRRWLVLGGVGLCWGALTVAACSGDDTGGGSGLATDGGLDSTTGQDAAEEPSATMDAPGIDSRTPADAEADADAATADAGTDGSRTCTAFDASTLDEASVAAGFAQVWQVYKCYGCHQASSQTVNDAGMGIVLSGNNAGLGDSGTIFPPNLTNDPATGLGCWSDPQAANAILNGVDDDGRTLCSPMPKFSLALTTPDGGPKLGYPMDAGTAQEIVDYLRSLPVAMNQVHETTCSGPADGGSDASTDSGHD